MAMLLNIWPCLYLSLNNKNYGVWNIWSMPFTYVHEKYSFSWWIVTSKKSCLLTPPTSANTVNLNDCPKMMCLKFFLKSKNRLSIQPNFNPFVAVNRGCEKTVTTLQHSCILMSLLLASITISNFRIALANCLSAFSAITDHNNEFYQS